MGIQQTLNRFGPGLIMASSAIGGSHIIASTQAGASFGLQLAGFIVAVNLLKYPFYRFAYRYALNHGQSVLQGYAAQGNVYLWLFLLFNGIATVVNIAGGALLSAALLSPLLPFDCSLTWLSIAVLISFLLILAKKQYPILDMLSKNLMLILTVITIIALVMAVWSVTTEGSRIPADFVEPSPWTFASIPFLIALMGWMPAPMELSVATSMWVVEKQHLQQTSVRDGMLDFNVGYGVTIALALVFMTLGALMQYGQDIPQAAGGKYVAQFVNMYAQAIGEWTRWFIGLLAFVCIYGTTLTAVDGYSRTNMTAVHLLLKRPHTARNEVFWWMLGASIVSFVIIVFFQSSVGKMIPFAMTMSFISAPMFAWLNFTLYRDGKGSHILSAWAWLGLAYLVAMLILYFYVKF